MICRKTLFVFILIAFALTLYGCGFKFREPYRPDKIPVHEDLSNSIRGSYGIKGRLTMEAGETVTGTTIALWEESGLGSSPVVSLEIRDTNVFEFQGLKNTRYILKAWKIAASGYYSVLYPQLISPAYYGNADTGIIEIIARQDGGIFNLEDYPLGQGDVYSYQDSEGYSWSLINSGISVISGKNCSVMSMVANDTIVQKNYWIKEGSGIYEYAYWNNGILTVKSSPSLLLSFPMQEGSIWQVRTDTRYFEDNYSYSYPVFRKVLGKETIVINGYAYEAFKIEEYALYFDRHDNLEFIWIIRDIGTAKSLILNEYQSYEYSLTGFSVN